MQRLSSCLVSDCVMLVYSHFPLVPTPVDSTLLLGFSISWYYLVQDTFLLPSRLGFHASQVV